MIKSLLIYNITIFLQYYIVYVIKMNFKDGFLLKKMKMKGIH